MLASLPQKWQEDFDVSLVFSVRISCSMSPMPRRHALAALSQYLADSARALRAAVVLADMVIFLSDLFHQLLGAKMGEAGLEPALQALSTSSALVYHSLPVPPPPSNSLRIPCQEFRTEGEGSHSLTHHPRRHPPQLVLLPHPPGLQRLPQLQELQPFD